MSIILASEQIFKASLFNSIECLNQDYEYIFTPHFCHFDLIVRNKDWTQVYIEHKERADSILDLFVSGGLMFNKCKLLYYNKYLSGSLVFIATTIRDKIYWTRYIKEFNDLKVVERNQDVVFIPFHYFSDNIDLLAEQIIIYFN